MNTLDTYDAQLNETIHTNAVHNVFYPSLTTDGSGDNALVIQSLLNFLNTVTLPAGNIRVNMTGGTLPIEIPAGKTLQGQPNGSTNLRFHISAPMHNPRGIGFYSDTVLQDLNISQIGHATSGSSILVYARNVNNVIVRNNRVLGPSLPRQSFTAKPSNPFYVRDSSNILIENSEFAGAQNHFCAELLNVTNSQIVRSKFHTNGWHGLKVQSTTSTPLNLEVSESQFYNNGRTVPDTGVIANGNGIDMYGRGIVVRDSVAHGNYGTGFQVKPGNGHSASDITFIRSESHHQQSVGGSGYHGFGIWHGEFPGAINNIRFVDSYSHHNNGSGFWVGDNATNVSIINSVADFNLGVGLRLATTSEVTQANFTGTGNVAGWVAVVGGVVPTDVNGDGFIDGADASILFLLWQKSGIADLNRDGIVDGADLATLFAYWTGDSAATTSQTHPTALRASRKTVALKQTIPGNQHDHDDTRRKLGNRTPKSADHGASPDGKTVGVTASFPLFAQIGTCKRSEGSS